MRQMIHIFLVLIVTQLTLGCGSTTLLMKDGRQLHGMVTSSDANQIQLKSVDEVSGLSVTEGSVMSVNRSDVQEVEYAGDSTEKWGIGLTATGGGTALLGLVVLNTGDGWGAAIIGAMLIGASAPLVLTGVPLWIAGALKKDEQRDLYEVDAQTGMFNTPTQPGTYNLTLRF